MGVTQSPVSGLRMTVRLSVGSSSTTEQFSNPK